MHFVLLQIRFSKYSSVPYFPSGVVLSLLEPVETQKCTTRGEQYVAEVQQDEWEEPRALKCMKAT